jgi:glycosyltransferase involved in cell wall biosynthesis
MLTVSVALASYNGEPYIAEQLTSILTQEPAITELIVADDGSEDQTVEIVRRVHAPFAGAIELRILPAQAAHGTVANFSRAMQSATGDLVVLSDQDDRWHPGRVAAALAYFEADPELLLTHADARLVDGAGRPTGEHLFGALGVTPHERQQLAAGHAFEAYLRRNLATGATIMFRRSLLDAALPVAPGWLHDEWLAAIAAGLGHAAFIPDDLIDYRQHGGNQVGVRARTLRYRIERMFEPRGDRLQLLKIRAEGLLGRLEAMGVDPETVALARGKALFERRRAAYPARRIARIPQVIAQRSSYPRFSSQGRLDPLRDVLQPD